MSETFTVRHVHAATVERVFACLTEPEHLTRFWGSVGTSTPVEGIVVDLRPGGAFETTMVNDTTGHTHTMRAEYLRVDRPTFLSWRETDSGVVTELALSPLDDGTTEVVTTRRGLPPQMRTPEALAGWGTALDRMSAYLSEGVSS
ncbi:MAG: Activator of Hsp90 ATPase 1 family protein [Frankiales bacterium]|nr:Activator of Hsp90 ATPase 1 family protein [Frankiales bacterium]